MPIGLWILLVVGILIAFGVGQRVLDRMRLTDRQALVYVVFIFVGGIIPDIQLTTYWSVNIGGAIIPLILCIHLFIKAGTTKERVRAVAAAILSGAAVYLIGRFFPAEPEGMYFEPTYLYGIAAGIIAYLMGRSRRSAFIGGVMGVLLADITQGIISGVNGIPAAVRLGGAGAFDAVVVSGIVAVLAAELIGEARERLQGGTSKKDMVIEDGEFVKKEEAKHEEH